MFVTKLGHYPVVLGIPWLELHDVAIRFSSRTLTFGSQYCASHCNQTPTVVHAHSLASKIAHEESVVSAGAGEFEARSFTSPNSFFQNQVDHGKDYNLGMGVRSSNWRTRPNETSICDEKSTTPETSIFNQKSSAPETHVFSDSVTFDGTSPGLRFPTPERPMQISAIGGHPFRRLAYKHKLTIFSTSLYEINQALGLKEQSKEPKDELDLKDYIPTEYHEFLPLFSEALAKNLPPHRPYDHKIPLREGFTPPYGPLYSMSRTELQTLKDWLEENLSKGFIRASSSPAASPILFVKKTDGSLRLCVDYRGLNAGTIKNRYPLPLLQETLMRLSKAKYFTTLDIRGAYNLVRMAEGEEWKTAFRTRYGLFESLVMPFGLTNAPSDFQALINDVLRAYLDDFCTAFLDDIFIYSSTLKEHKEQVYKVLKALSDAGLHLKPEKCHFHKQEVKYLGFIITTKGIQMDPEKVSCVLGWEVPKTVTDVQCFLGFANFYRRFIKDYSKVVTPLTRMTKKEGGKYVPFIWGPEQQAAFDLLKKAFTTAPVLRHFDYDREIIVETDASDYVSAGILSQYDDDGVLHPVAFYSRKHSPAECNYEIYDKELMAIVRAFEEWRPHLEGSRHPIQVLSDHKNLEYFMSTKLLNRRQARWSEFLSRFDFRIIYRPGKAGGKPDALTRRSGDLPKEGDERLLTNRHAVLKPQNLIDLPNTKRPDVLDVVDGLSLMANDVPDAGPPDARQQDAGQIATLLAEAYQVDQFPGRILRLLQNGTRQCKEISLADCKEIDGRLIYRDCIYVPDHVPLRLRLLQNHHDPPAVGHPGRAKTLELLARRYYWPSMRKDVDRFVRNCHVCRRTKSTRHAPYGVLRPLSVPERPWQHISVDFVTGLPRSKGFDAICVVVDRLTKQRHLIPCTTTITAEGLVDLFCDRIFRYHGLPETIVSDRGPQFASRFWKHLCFCLKIDPRLSTAFHPQTDGQTERVNAVVEQHLRAYVTYLQDDWVDYLFLAEFAGNNQVSDTTSLSPFFANLGYHPRYDFELDIRVDAPEEREAQTAAERLERIHEVARVEMRYAQMRQADGADRHRMPAPAFQPGDLVWVDGRNWRTARPSRKLENKHHGPYRVIRTIGTHAYELDIPATIQKHRTFPVSLLHAAAEDPLPGQVTPPPLPVMVEGEEEWEVEEILDSRRIRGRLQYLVKWRGFTDPTWEPEENLTEVEAVDTYHERYPARPAPIRAALVGTRA
jgi:transposase InsO family protein